MTHINIKVYEGTEEQLAKIIQQLKKYKLFDKDTTINIQLIKTEKQWR